MDLQLRSGTTGPTPAARGGTAAATTGAVPAPAGGEGGKPVAAGGKNLPAAAEVAKAITQIEGYLATSQRQLRFQVDEGSGRTVIRVVNPDNGELVRQIPSEEVLKVAAAITSGRPGLVDDLA
jgi:hypothetical protein